MSSWSEGYVTDIAYIYGYYHELNPLRLRLAFAEAGLVAPEIKTACELGFGQGVSINIHAAAGSASWHGTDFNPAQAGFARDLRAACGSDAALFDDSFADFAARTDLPGFDYIGLHGIWSWIDDRNRAVLVDFIRRRLNVGGVLYVSYNALPGQVSMVPVREMLAAHSAEMGAPGQGMASRIGQSFDFLERLMQASPAYARLHGDVAGRLAKIRAMNPHYLAHEYFNRDWEPTTFRRIAEWLGPAKLDFACSAHFLDQVDGVNLTQPQQDLLKEIAPPLLRQQARDFMVNQGFRRDYWVKGARRLGETQQIDSLRGLRVTLGRPRSEIALKVTAALGEVELREDIYNAVLDSLANCRPHTLGEIADAVEGRISFAQIRQAVLILAGREDILLAQSDEAIAAARPRTAKLNAVLTRSLYDKSDATALASAVSGGGIVLKRFDVLFLEAVRAGHDRPEDWARHVLAILGRRNQRLVKDGKALTTPEENLAELTSQAEILARQWLPILKSLEIV